MFILIKIEIVGLMKILQKILKLLINFFVDNYRQNQNSNFYEQVFPTVILICIRDFHIIILYLSYFSVNKRILGDKGYIIFSNKIF